MPHFYNKQEQYFISVNFKVMYSSLRIQKHLKKIKLFWLRLSSKPKYVIGRNPYTRLESFYRDKLNKDLDQTDYWLRSQKIFFKPLEIKKSASIEKKYTALKNISFQEFIHFLPEVYMNNRHLHPQYKIFKNLKVEKKFKMESEKDKHFIEENLKLDLSKKANTTEKAKFDLQWNDAMYKIVNELYKDDFEYFNYPKK